MANVWLIASGKGGVGKSTITAGLGTGLARAGKRVCIVDTDIGLRDQDFMLGLENRVVFDLIDVAKKECLLAEALISPEATPGLSLLPASQFARSKDLDAQTFRSILVELKAVFDHILIDCPAGIERGLRSLLNEELTHTLLICTPDDVCIRNAERVAGLLAEKQAPAPQVIVNRLQEDLIRAGEMYSAQTVAQTLDLPLLGEVPDDRSVYRAALQHLPLMDVQCAACQALQRIVRRMNDEDAPLPGYGTAATPWFRQLFRPKLKEVTRIDHR